MRRRTLLGTAAAGLAAGSLKTPSLAQKGSAGVLRFVPQANLANADPIWTTATVAINHGMMVWDTLYGIDNSLTARPQMCAGQETSADELTWTFTLRDGLLFHDSAPVRAVDCTTSIERWSKKDPFGQRLAALTEEMKPLDDKRFQIRLKKPFRQMLYALGAQYCFIMPERMAKTPATQQINEYVGSGPFVFMRDEWVSGAKAVYTKFDRYVPRQEPPQYFSGGKQVNFGRVEWIIQPDPATAASALQTGEVDWIEQPLLDLLPSLAKMNGIEVGRFDPLGVLAMVAFNHLHPPFDNPALLRALLPAVDQAEFVQSVVGDQASLAKVPAGYFTVGSPMANTAGLEALTGKRDLAEAKRQVAAAGYKGEKIVLMAPTDQPPLIPLAQMTRDLLIRLGLNVDFQAMDWGTLVARRAKQDPPDQGGWNVFCTTWAGLATSNPGSSYPLNTVGRTGWFGWAEDPKIIRLREAWFEAPDLAAQKAICAQIQLQALQSVPFIPLGQWYQPTVFRKDLTGFVQCANMLFWGVRRV
ncbi:MAG: ABC transporter substrate-binding protein [Acetobacteraceae bacterium]